MSYTGDSRLVFLFSFDLLADHMCERQRTDPRETISFDKHTEKERAELHVLRIDTND
jgi:hypothetical protein